MNRVLNKIAAIMLTMAVVCMIGCKKTDDPDNGGNNGNNGGNNSGNEEPNSISSNEVNNNGYTIVEVEYGDESKMYFRILTPTTAEVVNCDQFYGAEHITEGYIYRNDVVVPSSFTHLDHVYDVVAIGESAFFRCTGLASVDIPNSVIEIRPKSFSGCSELVNVSLGSGLQSIGSNAFLECGKIVSLGFPNSLKSIDSYAFSFCLSLHDIELPSELDYLGNNVFDNCTNLVSAALPIRLLDIPDGLFYNCSKLSSVQIPSLVQTIGCNSFAGTNISTIVIPNSTRIIKSGAFNGCNELTTISFGNQLEKIEAYAFQSCSSLSSIELPDNLQYVGDYCFKECTNLQVIRLAENMSSISEGIFFACTSLQQFVIPNNITTIFDKAFAQCDHLEVLTIGANVNSISFNAFEGCSSLSTLYFNAINCENVGHMNYSSCFSNCRITNLTIGDNVIHIPSYAFSHCMQISELVLPYSIIAIGDYAFNSCNGIAGILNLPESIVSIGERAFSNCDGFIGNLVIPESVNEIGNRAFGDCDHIVSVTINSSLSICDDAFAGCSSLTSVYYNAPRSTTVAPLFINCDALENIVIGESVEVIPDNAFNGYLGTISFENPSGIMEIGQSAFLSCQGLPSVLEFENADKIGTGAFGYCNSVEYIRLNSIRVFGSEYGKENNSYNENLIEIYFGENIEQFWGVVLHNCPRLTTITIAAVTPPNCIDPILYLNTTPAFIYVPEESVSAYKEHVVWGRLKERIRPIP